MDGEAGKGEIKPLGLADDASSREARECGDKVFETEGRLSCRFRRMLRRAGCRGEQLSESGEPTAGERGEDAAEASVRVLALDVSNGCDICCPRGSMGASLLLFLNIGIMTSIVVRA